MSDSVKSEEAPTFTPAFGKGSPTPFYGSAIGLLTREQASFLRGDTDPIVLTISALIFHEYE